MQSIQLWPDTIFAQNITPAFAIVVFVASVVMMLLMLLPKCIALVLPSILLSTVFPHPEFLLPPGKAGLKLNIQKTKIMASGPITSWEIDEETVETMSDFIFGGSKITADGDCSHELKRRLLFGRKVMTNLDSILKAETLLYQQRSIWSRLWFFQWSCMDVRVGL